MILKILLIMVLSIGNQGIVQKIESLYLDLDASKAVMQDVDNYLKTEDEVLTEMREELNEVLHTSLFQASGQKNRVKYITPFFDKYKTHRLIDYYQVLDDEKSILFKLVKSEKRKNVFLYKLDISGVLSKKDIVNFSKVN